MADDRTLAITREVLEVATVVAPLPPWVPRWLAGWLAAVVVAAVVVLARHVDLGEVLRAWNRAAAPEPEVLSPPMPTGEGGMTLSQKPPEDNL